jgi:hypothetical protein
MTAQHLHVSGFQSQLEWDAEHSERSPRFRRDIDRQRLDAHRPHPRALPRRTIAAYAAGDLVHPGQWRVTSGRYSLEFVDRYVDRCKRIAKREFHTDALWPLIHELASRETGYDLGVGPAGPPAVSGPLASTLVAEKMEFDSWLPGGATSMRVQRYQFGRDLRLNGYSREVFPEVFKFVRQQEL